MEWILPFLTLTFNNEQSNFFGFFGCVNDYQRYENRYKRFGDDK